MSRSLSTLLAAATLWPAAADPVPAQVTGAAPWSPPAPRSVRPPVRGAAPILACTPAELERLRAAYRRGDDAVTRRLRDVPRRLTQAVGFPARGGQHNQWYQCDDCQLALHEVDASHHRCTGCDRVYSGPPYDDVLFSRLHSRNMTRAKDAAWAYALTGDRRFAADAAQILLGYAARYRAYPYHTSSPVRDAQARAAGRPLGTSGGHILEQTLSEAAMLIGTTLPAIDLIWPALTEPQRAVIRDDLVRPMLQNIARCRRGKSNWQSFHNAAMFAGGVILGDAAFMRRALFDTRDGFLTQMRISVSSDGMWYENSWGYHLYTLRALADLAQSTRRCGIDLWGHPTLRQMCALPAQYAMPGGVLPRFGDDVNSSVHAATGVLEAAFAATGDAAIEDLLPAAPTWEGILHGRVARARATAVPAATAIRSSAVFRGAGHAILRTAGPGELTAAFTFGPFGGFHGHFDKLSFVFYGFGEELGVDPGRARSQAYRLPIHRHWYRGTIAHNAVVVDGKPQRGAAGELLAFVTGETFAAAAARTTKAYPGIIHSRCLVLRHDYLLVIDRLTADRPHEFTWVYHNRGTGVTCAAAANAAGEPAALRIEGAEYLDLLGSGATAGPIRARVTGKRVDTAVTLAAGAATEVHIGTGVGASTLDRVPMILARRTGEAVLFAAVLEPVLRGTKPEVASVHLRPADAGSATGSAWVIEIERSGATDRVAWDGGGDLEVR